MADYSIAEKRIERPTKPRSNFCGICGSQTDNSLFCNPCSSDIHDQLVISNQIKGKLQ